jgi:hypothetical protein
VLLAAHGRVLLLCGFYDFSTFTAFTAFTASAAFLRLFYGFLYGAETGRIKSGPHQVKHVPFWIK